MFCGSVVVVAGVRAEFRLNTHPQNSRVGHLRLRSALLLLVLGGGFLGDAMFYGADFLFDFGDFVGFHVGGKRAVPLGEGFFPLGGGLFAAALLGVNVAEVRVNVGIVGIAFDGFVQPHFGFVVFALLVVNPAEAVEICAVVGFELERGLDHFFGFVEALAEIAEHEAVIVERGAVAGIHRDYFFELLFGAIVLLLAFVDGAEEEIGGLVVARIAGERFGGLGGFFGFLVAAAALVNLRDVQISFAVGFGVGELRAQNFYSFVDLAVFGEQRCFARLHGGIFRIFCDGFLADLQRLREVARFAVGVHQKHARAAVFFVAEVAKLVVGVRGGLVILTIAIELAELLVKDGERAAARWKHRRLLDADDGVGEHAD